MDENSVCFRSKQETLTLCHLWKWVNCLSWTPFAKYFVLSDVLGKLFCSSFVVFRWLYTQQQNIKSISKFFAKYFEGVIAKQSLQENVKEYVKILRKVL